ncbi:MAG: hypothetical protein U5K31_12190 [Balneolaceae bacterium]|nr:hypothetical protein [Balneolaceae bacterium]
MYPEDTDYINERGDNRDFAFVWDRDDYIKIIDLAVDQVYMNEQKSKAFWESKLQIFFDANFKENTSKEVQEKQIQYLKECISSKCEQILIPSVYFPKSLKKLPSKKRRNLIELFLKSVIQVRMDDFKTLQLEPSSWGGVGSMVPVFSGRIKFFESLLPLMNSADLLSHKQLIETKIESLEVDLQREKKRDFLSRLIFKISIL